MTNNSASRPGEGFASSLATLQPPSDGATVPASAGDAASFGGGDASFAGAGAGASLAASLAPASSGAQKSSVLLGAVMQPFEHTVVDVETPPAQS